MRTNYVAFQSEVKALLAELVKKCQQGHLSLKCGVCKDMMLEETHEERVAKTNA